MITPWVALGGFFHQTFEGEKRKKVFSDQVCARVSACGDPWKSIGKTARGGIGDGSRIMIRTPLGGAAGNWLRVGNHDSGGGSCDHDIAR